VFYVENFRNEKMEEGDDINSMPHESKQILMHFF
jgi:hypothetical protein